MPDATPPVWSQLRPGAPVLRRETGLLQVGLDVPERTLLADTPVVRALLARLRTGCPHPAPGAGSDPEELAAWHRLAAASLLVRTPTDLAAGAAGAAGAFLATAAWAGPAVTDRLSARRRGPVRLLGSTSLVEPVARLALLGGLVLDPGSGSGSGAGSGSGTVGVGGPSLVVVLHEGEARRGQHDSLVAAGQAHLPVWWRGGLPHVGPLVVPGVTACLRCLDAHESEADPRRPLLIEQAARETAPPHDPVLAALATAWTVREAQRWVEGEAPTTWSATARLGPDGPAHLTSWARHPYCGCAWDAVPAA